MRKWKFYFETFGCKVNQYESQAYAEAWRGLGGLETEKPEEADYIFINSCAITARAERDARNAVYRLRRQSPSARIILAGCAVELFEAFHPRRKANYAKPDLCLRQSAKAALFHGPEPVLAGGAELPPLKLSPERFDRARAIVKVQDGCRQNCAYCIVPKIRTELQSEEPGKILEECRRLYANGHAELMISGVNLRLYGKDRPEYGDFWDLLAWLDKELARDFPDGPRLRLSSIEPAQLGEKALRTLAEGRLICPHLHLSLQHASPKVLREMGRGHYRTGDILDFCRELSRVWPLFSLGADILTGFPGESGEDVRILLDFIENSPLTYAHVFPYSARPGTVAAARSDQIPQKIRQERAKLLRVSVRRKQLAFWEKVSLLPEMRIICEYKPDGESGLTRGVNEFYIPCFSRQPPGRGITRARALGVIEKGLLVESLQE